MKVRLGVPDVSCFVRDTSKIKKLLALMRKHSDARNQGVINSCMNATYLYALQSI